MGKRTSIYLSDEDEQRRSALGVTISDVIGAGLDALEAEQGPPKRRRGGTSASAAKLRIPSRTKDPACTCPAYNCPVHCPHPPGRRDAKNRQLCRLCGSTVPA